jgi:tRNA pseudouridine32 synthase/23S rRNA pseudouridine746 synthase
MPPAIDLLYQDHDLLIVAKPEGLLSVPGRGEDKQDCLAARVVAQVADALVVHRLDMSTSGLMAFARGKAAQRRLSAAFAERRVNKRYVAVVDGLVPRDDGEIDLPLLTDWPNRPRQKVDPLQGKPALTRYAVVARDPGSGTTRVALEPVTGRSHQLRVHLLALGHPIVGDALYAPPAVRERSGRLLLHAESLCLPHPSTGEPLRFHHPSPF